MVVVVVGMLGFFRWKRWLYVERLWAPWRLEYVQNADKQDGCVFCRGGEHATTTRASRRASRRARVRAAEQVPVRVRAPARRAVPARR